MVIWPLLLVIHLQYVPLLPVEEHMGNGHPVLSQSTRLVRTDHVASAQGLNRLQLLHQAVLRRHPLGRQRHAGGEGDRKTLRYIGYYQGDEEGEADEEIIAEFQAQYEEDRPDPDGENRNYLDESSDLLVNRRFLFLQRRRETGYVT